MSMEDTEILVIKKRQMIHLLLAYPDIKTEMVKLSKQRTQNNVKAILIAKKAGYLLAPQKYYIYIYIYIG